MELKGKTYSRKNSQSNDLFKVSGMDGDFVLFENGAKCKIETLQSDFMEVFAMNESAPAGEIDPDAFFNTPTNADLVFNDDPSKINISSSAKDVSNPNSLENRFNEEPATSMANYKGPQYPNIGNDNQPIVTTNEEAQPKSNRPPEWELFDRMKKTEEITINIPFKVKVPKATKIEAMNDTFETSLTEYLAVQFVRDNVVKNSEKVRLDIQTAIEEWMEKQIYGKSKKKTNKSDKKNEEIVSEEPTPSETKKAEEAAGEKVIAGSIDEQLRPKQLSWDGDIYKLSCINTDVQYTAVAAEVAMLKGVNGNVKVIDRFEDLMSIYKSQ